MPDLVVPRALKYGETAQRLRLGGAAILAAAGLAVAASPAEAATYQVPASVVSDCSVDVTSVLQSWIASVPDNSTLSFGTNACYRVEGTISISDRQGLDLEGNGSTFQSFNAPVDARPIWQASQSSGLIFRNMTITGSYAHGGTFTSSLQHSHGIDLRGTSAEVADVSINDIAGDCVYFGLGSDNTTRSSGSFHNSSCTGTSRNGVSVTAGNNVLVQYDTMSHIGYDVFDVEPNVGAGNWGAQNVTFDSNTIGPYALSIFSVVPNAPLDSLYFTNNMAEGVGLKVTTGSTTTAANRPQGVTITGNVSNTPQTPAAMNLDSIDGLTVTGNTVPLTGGTMASVTSSCNASVSSNGYPGGTSEVSVAPYSACSTSTTPPTTSPTTATTNTTAPAPTVQITRPSSNSMVTGNQTRVSATASASAVKLSIYIDGTLMASASGSSINWPWNLKKVTSGSHIITVDAWDASKDTGSSCVMVYK